MDRQELENRIRSIVHEQRTLEEDALEGDKTLAEVGIDSLDALNILYEIESEFQITIDDDEARGFTRLSELVDLVEKKCSENVSA